MRFLCIGWVKPAEIHCQMLETQEAYIMNQGKMHEYVERFNMGRTNVKVSYLHGAPKNTTREYIRCIKKAEVEAMLEFSTASPITRGTVDLLQLVFGAIVPSCATKIFFGKNLKVQIR